MEKKRTVWIVKKLSLYGTYQMPSMGVTLFESYDDAYRYFTEAVEQERNYFSSCFDLYDCGVADNLSLNVVPLNRKDFFWSERERLWYLYSTKELNLWYSRITLSKAVVFS